MTPDRAPSRGGIGLPPAQTSALAGIEPVPQPAALESTLAACPDSEDDNYRRGRLLASLGRHAEALEAYDLALAIQGGVAEVLNSRAVSLCALRRYQAALDDFDGALDLAPESVDYTVNRARVLLQLSRLAESIACFDKAVALSPDSVPALVGLANALVDAGSPEHALEFFRRAYEADPTGPALGNWHDASLSLCLWDGFEARTREMEARIDRGELVAGPFTMLGVTESPARQLRAAELYARRKHSSQHVLPDLDRQRVGGGRIRLGYFSGDFRNHPVGKLTAGLFEAHDRSRFSLVGYSLGKPVEDELRCRVADAFDELVDADGMTDEEVARDARRRGLHVAIDLGGYTGNSRPGIFAHRVAPIQIGYLGYPGTVGGGILDYLVADRWTVPESDRPHFSEKLVYLPSYLIGDSRRQTPVRRFSREECGLRDAGFVYCCHNNPTKFRPHTFAQWMRILRAVPGSVLWLAGSHAVAMANLRRAAESHGIAPDRLVFAPRLSSQDDYLARYTMADLFLDTLPYNAHSTACDALWAGLPVLTCLGNSFPGRVAASIVDAAGLTELIANSSEDYEAKAIALAQDPDRLAGLRQMLDRNRAVSRLFDTKRFTRSLESAFTEICRRHDAGLENDHVFICE